MVSEVGYEPTPTQDGVRSVNDLKSYDNNWEKFIVRFEIYLKAKNKHTSADDIKAAMLLNLVGDEAFDVYKSFLENQTDTYVKNCFAILGDVLKLLLCR